jgi:hypothetical protein
VTDPATSPDRQRRDRVRRIRVWAVQQGHIVPWTGRLPAWIVKLYELDQARRCRRQEVEREEEEAAG